MNTAKSTESTKSSESNNTLCRFFNSLPMEMKIHIMGYATPILEKKIQQDIISFSKTLPAVQRYYLDHRGHSMEAYAQFKIIYDLIRHYCVYRSLTVDEYKKKVRKMEREMDMVICDSTESGRPHHLFPADNHIRKLWGKLSVIQRETFLANKWRENTPQGDHST